MLLTEFDEVKYRQMTLEEGREIGKQEGELIKLIQMVCRKLNKGKLPIQITDELEEDPEVINRICEAAKGSEPEYSYELILQRL